MPSDRHLVLPIVVLFSFGAGCFSEPVGYDPCEQSYGESAPVVSFLGNTRSETASCLTHKQMNLPEWVTDQTKLRKWACHQGKRLPEGRQGERALDASARLCAGLFTMETGATPVCLNRMIDLYQACLVGYRGSRSSVLE